LKGQGKPRPNGLQPARLGKEENPFPSQLKPRSAFTWKIATS
jgi:hypothetical protein